MPAELAWAGVFTDKADFGSEEVEFFAAIEAKDIDATMLPNLEPDSGEVSFMTYARFRLHRGDEIGPTGLGDNFKEWVGEVEDYKIVVSNLDFGDAPELPQPTD